MKRFLGLSVAVLCAAFTFAAPLQANDKKDGGPFSQASDDSHYLVGAVPEENGKVIFRKSFQLPGVSQQEIINTLQAWQKKQDNANEDNLIKRNVLQDDPQKGIIQHYNTEYLIFVDRGLSLDRAEIAYAITYQCAPEKCDIEISRIRYDYEKKTHTAENWISDKMALDKSGSKIYPGLRRARVKTIDRVDAIFNSLNNAFRDMQLARYTTTENTTASQSAATVVSPSTPTVISAPNTSPAPATAAPATTTPSVTAPVAAPVTVPAPAVSAQPATTPARTLSYQNITPEQIMGNIFRLMEQNILVLSIGDKQIILDQGSMGIRNGKPVILTEVSSAWINGSTSYRIFFCDKSYREQVEQAIQATKTSSNALLSEGWMILSCKTVETVQLTAQQASLQLNGNKTADALLIGEITQVSVR